MLTIATCITTYNCENKIKEVIESCIFQEQDSDQIIVVDDCSEDSTFEIANAVLKNFKGSKVLYKFKNNNGGPAWSRNKGLELSNCQFTAFLDGDDLALPYRIKYLKKYFTKSSPDLLIHGMMASKIDFQRKMIKPIYKLDTISRKNCKLEDFLLTSKLSPGSALVLKTEVGRICRFSEDQDIIAGEDKELAIKLCENSFIVNSLKESLCLYNIGSLGKRQSNHFAEHITSPYKTKKIVTYLINKYADKTKKNVLFELELSGLIAIYKIEGISKFIKKFFSHNFLITFLLIYTFLKKSISQFSNKYIISKLEVWKFKKFIKKKNSIFKYIVR